MTPLELRLVFWLSQFSGLEEISPALLARATAVVRLVAPSTVRAFPAVGEPPAWADKRLGEVVLAYGLGYFRVQDLWIAETSLIRWPAAEAEFRHRILVQVQGTISWLVAVSKVGGLYADSMYQFAEDIAHIIATLLLHGCDCFLWKQIPGADRRSPGDNDSNREKHRRRCKQQHYLVEWDPEKMALETFLMRAIRGDLHVAKRRRCQPSRRPQFAVNAFIKGLFFQVGRFEFGLRVAELLVWICDQHGHPVFYQQPCQFCEAEKPGRGWPARAVALKTIRWLALPPDRGGSFMPIEALKCAECESIVPQWDWPQPPCGHGPLTPPRPAQTKLVWVPATGRHIALDEHPPDDPPPISAPPVTRAPKLPVAPDADLALLRIKTQLLPPAQRRCAEIFLAADPEAPGPAPVRIERLLAQVTEEMRLTHDEAVQLREVTYINLRKLILNAV